MSLIKIALLFYPRWKWDGVNLSVLLYPKAPAFQSSVDIFEFSITKHFPQIIRINLLFFRRKRDFSKIQSIIYQKSPCVSIPVENELKLIFPHFSILKHQPFIHPLISRVLYQKALSVKLSASIYYFSAERGTSLKYKQLSVKNRPTFLSPLKIR